jgi:hypothetical protein
VLVLAGGLGISYLVWRQLDTKTVTLAAEPPMSQAGNGEMCGNVSLKVDARTLALWPYRLGEGQRLSGAMVVQGDEDADIGFRIRTPHNRLLLRDPHRQHEQLFDIDAPVRGDYVFELDNRHSTLTEKTVVLLLCVG